MMQAKSISTMFLSAVAVLVSPVLLAQVAPMNQNNNPVPNASQQPGSLQPGAQNGAGMAGAMTGTSTDEGQAMKDKMFLRKAAQGGMAEVQLGQLAAEKGSSEDVKRFGQRMVTDHTALNNDMKPIAESMGVAVPRKLSKEDQAEYDKLKGLSGADFDKEYIAFMVKDHHADLREFRGESATVQDPALRAAVQKGQSVIREHAMMVDKMAQTMGIPVPQRGGQTMPPSQ
jgi:putative membrane protein